MRLLIALTLAAGIASAQRGAADAMKVFASGADIQGLIAKAKTDRKDNQPTVTEPILRLAPYNVNLEYRPAVGPAAIHETEAEMFYVIDGSATMVTGGTLIEPTRNGVNLTAAKGIQGGTPRQVAKGDFIIVPEGEAHWFSQIPGTLVLMSFHVPRPVPAGK